MSYTLEPISEAHRLDVVDIFNHYIEHGFAAFFEQPVPPAFFDRILEAVQRYPGCVAMDENGKVVGFAFLRAHHPALPRAGELSYFIRPEHTRQGLGGRMLEWIVERAPACGVDNLLASVSSPNESSLAFHRRQGFTECGRFVAVGRKLGRDFDVIWMQRRLKK